MKAEISKKYVLSFMFGTLFTITGFAQAETPYLPAKYHQEMLSASTVIEHNDRLLTNTSIGKAIKRSTDNKARQLYEAAQRLFNQATQALSEGQEEMAKNLAYKSIGYFYQSDKAHHGL